MRMAEARRMQAASPDDVLVGDLPAQVTGSAGAHTKGCLDEGTVLARERIAVAALGDRDSRRAFAERAGVLERRRNAHHVSRLADMRILQPPDRNLRARVAAQP